MRKRRGRGWAIARQALERLLREHLGAHADIDIGRLNMAGEGLFRKVYSAVVESPAGLGDIPSGLVVLVPDKDAPPEVDERALREPTLLRRLAELDLPIRTPRWATTVEHEGRHILVREHITGGPVDLRGDRQARVPPWQIVGEVAATIHGIDPAIMSGLVPTHETRHHYAGAELAEVSEAQGHLVTDEALAWMRENLPPPEPACFLHGDLLGQNILMNLFDHPKPLSVIDWEYSRIGDPAYEMAIVTRGRRRPFRVSGGLDRLLEAYGEAGGHAITKQQVRFYELGMMIGWYLAAQRGEHPHGPDHVLGQLRGLLGRAKAGS